LKMFGMFVFNVVSCYHGARGRRAGQSQGTAGSGYVHSTGRDASGITAEGVFFFWKGDGGMDSGRVLKLRKMIDNGNADGFYSWKPWKRLRKDVLRLDHYECQLCKAKGRYSRAEIVHHVKHLKDRPDLALSIWDGEERQLVSVCRRCHEELHPESMEGRFPAAKREAVPEERWD
jgi:5-methylcytosine-specific restriction protein A